MQTKKRKIVFLIYNEVGGMMRVIAGKYKSIPLESLAGKHTRPTTDKVKESLFQMLGPFFPGGTMLDLYGGSGAIAIEAVSRGMEHAVIVEQNTKAQQVITQNIKKVANESCFTLLKMPVNEAIKSQVGTFDLVFLDPPYAKEQLVKDMERLAKYERVKPGRVVVCETADNVSLPLQLATFKQITIRNYGLTNLYFYRNEV